MLLPRFSIRMLLGLTTLAAFLCLAGNYAVRGQEWALGVMFAFLSFLAAFFVYILLFALVWALARVRSGFRPAKSRSPLAHSEPPPQPLTPSDPV